MPYHCADDNNHCAISQEMCLGFVSDHTIFHVFVCPRKQSNNGHSFHIQDSRPLVARFLILQDLEVVKLQNRCVLFVDCGIKLALAALSLRSSLAATQIFHFWHVFSQKKHVIFGQLHSFWMIFGLPFSPSRNTCSASPFHPRSHLDRNVWLQCTP